MKIVDCDYFVVGSGMAGLMSALHLAAYGKVVVATKEFVGTTAHDIDIPRV